MVSTAFQTNQAKDVRVASIGLIRDRPANEIHRIRARVLQLHVIQELPILRVTRSISGQDFAQLNGAKIRIDLPRFGNRRLSFILPIACKVLSDGTHRVSLTRNHVGQCEVSSALRFLPLKAIANRDWLAPWPLIHAITISKDPWPEECESDRRLGDARARLAHDVNPRANGHPEILAKRSSPASPGIGSQRKVSVAFIYKSRGTNQVTLTEIEDRFRTLGNSDITELIINPIVGKA